MNADPIADQRGGIVERRDIERARVLADWLNEFERVHLLLRLSGLGLALLHGYGKVLALATGKGDGFVAEQQGRIDDARAWYRRCIEADTEGTARRWAETRLQRLDAGAPD